MEQTISLQPRWSQGSLTAFRFFFVYFILYIFPFPLPYVPYSSVLVLALSDITLGVVNWISIPFFELTITRAINGSGDTTFDYAQLYLFLCLASFITIGWSILDSKRNDYEKLWYWLTILLRYYLAIIMIGYGMAKIFKTQFPFPYHSLNETYGESSPMGLLWNFMGYSIAYNIFTGLAEVLGGFLLFFKRTRLLGALVLFGVMSNVVMLNFAYDVPVKLFSSHLLVMIVFLLVPDIKRLFKLFVLNESIERESIKSIYSNEKTRSFYVIGKGILIVYLLIFFTITHLENRRHLNQNYYSSQANQTLGGEFEVKTFFINGVIIPRDSLPTRRWKTFRIEGGKASTQFMDSASMSWMFHRNIHNSILLISPDLSTTARFTFQADGPSLTIEGKLYQDSIKVVSTRIKDNAFLLVDRKFHWVNEFPYNK
jgi:hypothetical protein